ncbi:MAG: DNA repair protein RadA [Gammaproteobacteria bacterium]|nr:DNA repair protein RadA [Gammaproteobacteria bacterium]
MAKPRTVFVCSSCGGEAVRWQGQCPACGEWNTLSQFTDRSQSSKPANRRSGGAAPQPVQGLADLPEPGDRLSTGTEEFDRVLGGGLVAGSATLIGGDPGIGKSTLLLQSSAALAAQAPVLYATGEESVRQVGLRATRLGLGAATLKLVAETSVERILAESDAMKARVLVIDSIQTVATEAVESAPGSVSQLRESGARLVQHAKASGTAVFLIGHVTKEGTIAGPRVLEHLVDTVLYFESDSGSRYRIVRAVKNRFGAANEIGVFAMTEQGLREVKNPSAIFLSRHDAPVAGSVVTVTREGTRPMLIEVQALVDPAQGSNPRRVAVGYDGNRVAMLLAVLHRHAGIALHAHDVFVNVVGGVRLSETGADLPVLAAALSSLESRPQPVDRVVFGEVGLAGEIRPVPFGEERLREAAKHGFRHAVVPRANVPRKGVEGMRIDAVTRLDEAIAALSRSD